VTEHNRWLDAPAKITLPYPGSSPLRGTGSVNTGADTAVGGPTVRIQIGVR
jgi:hypothetical protein